MSTFTYFIFLIILLIMNCNALNLTENRCFLQESLTPTPNTNSDPILVSKNTNFLATMIRDIELYYQIKEPEGEIDEEYYCVDIASFQKYGNMIAPADMLTIKPGHAFIVDINYVIAPKSTFCIWNGATMSSQKCIEEITKLSQTLNLSSPALPQITDKSHYKLYDGASQYSTFPLIFSPSVSVTFKHDSNSKVCGRDVYFEPTKKLTDEFMSNLGQNVFTIYSFSKKLINKQFPREIIYTNDQNAVNLFRGFEHVPVIFKKCLKQTLNFQFPDLQYRLSAPPLPVNRAWNVYMTLIQIIGKFNKQVNKRGLLSSLFGPDPSVKELQLQSQVSSKAFSIIKANSHNLITNQKNLQNSMNRITIHESELTAAVKHQAHRSHQLAVNVASLSTFSTRRLERVAYIERLENLLSLSHLQLMSIKQEIESLSLESTKKCNFQPDTNPYFLCASHYPDFTIVSEDIHVFTHAVKYELSSYYSLECLRFGRQVFEYSGHHIKFEGERVLTVDTMKDGREFANLCLHSTRHCANLYKQVEPRHKIGPCGFLTDGAILAINCYQPTVITSADGQTFTVSDDPEFLQLSLLPLRLDTGESLVLADVLTILQSQSIMGHLDSTSDMTQTTDDIGSDEQVSKTPRIRTFHQKYQEFVSPKAVGPAKIFAGLLGLAILSLLLTCTCMCCRVTSLGACCQESLTEAAPVGTCEILRLCCPRPRQGQATPEPSAPILRHETAPLLPRSSSSAPTNLGAGEAGTGHHVYPELPSAPGFPLGDPEAPHCSVTAVRQAADAAARQETARVAAETAAMRTAGPGPGPAEHSPARTAAPNPVHYNHQTQSPVQVSNSRVIYKDGALIFNQ